MPQPRSLIPFSRGQTVEMVTVARAGQCTDEQQLRSTQIVKVIWHDRLLCQTDNGFFFARDTGGEEPPDPEYYRAIHTPGYEDLLGQETT